MELVSFSVTNYRSITKAHKINLSKLTVLVGKNNEGKSNLLSALSTAMNLMQMVASVVDRGNNTTRIFSGIDKFSRFRYYWKRDFPIQLRERKNKQSSIFELNFKLNKEESSIFQEKFKFCAKKNLSIKIKIGKDNEPDFFITKNKIGIEDVDIEKIIEFISSKISFNYIMAVRTEDTATAALSDVIDNEIAALERNEEYKKALDTIICMQRQTLEKLSENLRDPLKVFLPDLKEVNIYRRHVRDSHFLQTKIFRNDFDIIIDDGVATNVTYKGDGIKSLVALAILQDRTLIDEASIIAIEEPESHLHSGAIHSLVEIIQNISKNNKVIITTHNPLFVQRMDLKSNIIVNQGTAHEANSIEEIRNVLGVLPQDNLINARHVLLVEGEHDKTWLIRILSAKSILLKSALDNGNLAILALNGVGNLEYKINELDNYICNYLILLDHDKEAIEKVQKLQLNNLLKESKVKYVKCTGMKYSEFEDCIYPKLYKEKFLEAFNINIDKPEFKNNKKKWSDRLKDCFDTQGSNYNKEVLKKAKNIIEENIPTDINEAIILEKSGFLESVIETLERMVENK